jgi:phosphoribosylaminoimidazolecarboxamide formyltransferase / IMP cyclohydrolase
MPRIARALISVYDKTGLIGFAKQLADCGVELLSTGGTARALREAGLEVVDVGDYTGFPEMLDGRVKTLHPKVHGGLLYLRGNPQHETAVREHGIHPIDLVVVNLYPFEKTVARHDVTLDEAIENIDIGGPAMLRSAAKNHEFVTVLMDPNDYEDVARQIQSNGETTLEARRRLAMQVFARTSAYDAAIASHLVKVFSPPTPPPTEASGAPVRPASALPGWLLIEAPQVQRLRYGENPHQIAGLYGRFGDYFTQLHGKELSYNNLLDLTAAARLIAEFNEQAPTLAILKHTNPCGVGQGNTLREAWDKAFATDQQAPFGGVIGVNGRLDADCASAIAGIFSEVIVAPDYEPAALELLRQKKNLRLIRMLRPPLADHSLELRSVGAESYLLQQWDTRAATEADLEVVTRRVPTGEETRAMLFGWRIVKHVKSNAIVYVHADRTLGIGAGQMSRVDASRLAVWKAGEAGLPMLGSVVCSDAFFPFPDGLIAAAEAGATAAIQPGGSVRDAEVIAAADERGMAMAFTKVRHFRH